MFEMIESVAFATYQHLSTGFRSFPRSSPLSPSLPLSSIALSFPCILFFILRLTFWASEQKGNLFTIGEICKIWSRLVGCPNSLLLICH